jgi:hypothetical protein
MEMLRLSGWEAMMCKTNLTLKYKENACAPPATQLLAKELFYCRDD